MKLYNCGYLIKSGFQGIFTNRYMALASAGSMTACFMLIGIAALLSHGVGSLVDNVGRANEITVYLEAGMDRQTTHGVYYKLLEIDNVDSADYASPQENLEAMSEKLGETPETLLLQASDNPFLASYRIRIKDPALYNDTYAHISTLTGVYAVKGSPEVASIFIDFRWMIVLISSGVVALLTVVSILTVSNTIKLTVFNRRKEIHIMKYVGATDNFIRAPFLVEGIILGCIAALFAVALLFFGHWWISGQSDTWALERPELAYLLSNLSITGLFWIKMLLLFSAIGSCIGISGGGLFVRKYLRV